VIGENMDIVDPNSQENIGSLKSSVRESVSLRGYVSHVALVSSIHKTFNCSLEQKCDALMEDVEIDSKVSVDGSIMEYWDRMDFGFSYT
jgi:hypothetical protein